MSTKTKPIVYRSQVPSNPDREEIIEVLKAMLNHMANDEDPETYDCELFQRGERLLKKLTGSANYKFTPINAPSRNG